MKKTMITKIAALALAVCACAGGVSVCAAQNGSQNGAEPAAVKPTPEVAQPQYTAILYTYNYLNHLGNGRMNCQGTTTVRDGYNAGVKVELQQNNNGWTTIKTWTDKAYDFALVDEYYTVPSGHWYRLKVTFYSYTSGWSEIENVTKYSDIIWY